MKKKIKAWALIHPETASKIENEAYFNSGDCCCSAEPLSLAIYDKKRTAESVQEYYTYYHIVPIEITYALPKSKKK